jgi:hypothetical protein
MDLNKRNSPFLKGLLAFLFLLNLSTAFGGVITLDRLREFVNSNVRKLTVSNPQTTIVDLKQLKFCLDPRTNCEMDVMLEAQDLLRTDFQKLKEDFLNISESTKETIESSELKIYSVIDNITNDIIFDNLTEYSADQIDYLYWQSNNEVINQIERTLLSLSSLSPAFKELESNPYSFARHGEIYVGKLTDIFNHYQSAFELLQNLLSRLDLFYATFKDFQIETDSYDTRKAYVPAYLLPFKTDYSCLNVPQIDQGLFNNSLANTANLIRIPLNSILINTLFPEQNALMVKCKKQILKYESSYSYDSETHTLNINYSSAATPLVSSPLFESLHKTMRDFFESLPPLARQN